MGHVLTLLAIEAASMITEMQVLVAMTTKMPETKIKETKQPHSLNRNTPDKQLTNVRPPIEGSEVPASYKLFQAEVFWLVRETLLLFL